MPQAEFPLGILEDRGAVVTEPTPRPKPTQGTFLYRGNAVAAGGFLTKRSGERLPPDRVTVTTHAESCLPIIGGVSHSVLPNPPLPFPSFIRYGRCETYVYGSRIEDTAITVLRASVEGYQVTTSPSSDDDLPQVKSITFRSARMSIEVRSVHPPKGQPSFEIVNKPVAEGLFLSFTDVSGNVTDTPIKLEFDKALTDCQTMEALDSEFLRNPDFFKEHASTFVGKPQKLVFGKHKVPRTPPGYVVGSIVKNIAFGDKVIKGSVLTQPGFGSISFGDFILDEYSRRIAMATVRFGSDPGGDSLSCSIETNGIWK
jgi:hypothetical protein